MSYRDVGKVLDQEFGKGNWSLTLNDDGRRKAVENGHIRDLFRDLDKGTAPPELQKIHDDLGKLDEEERTEEVIRMLQEYAGESVPEQEDKVIQPGRCGDCRWFRPRSDGGYGECYVAPPRQKGTAAIRPDVRADDGCAQYSAAVLPQSGFRYAALGPPRRQPKERKPAEPPPRPSRDPNTPSMTDVNRLAG